MSDSEIILYQSEDGQTKVEVRMEGETVWLTLNQLAEQLHFLQLFGNTE